MSQFYSNESVSLEKHIDLTINLKRTNREDVNFVYEIDKCSKWIQENHFEKTCLQFPDYLLPDCTEVVCQMEKEIDKKVYVLGDTAYGSCCIDYVAAQHVQADSIIHFGRTCFSKTEEKIPCLKIYEKYPLNISAFCTEVNTNFTENRNDIIIIVDTIYLYKIDELKTECLFRICSVEDDLSKICDSIVVYLGEKDKKLMNINLTFNPKELYYFDPQISKVLEKYEQDLRIIKRRNFLIEAIKDSNTIGIVISTLAVRNYLKIIERMKTLAKLHSKKYYIISVGKPTVAKLANFPEVDIFVVVGCAMNEIYENRDYYKPIATPYDVDAALNPTTTNSQFSYDFEKLLLIDINESMIDELKKSDISLLTGQLRYRNEEEELDKPSETQSQIAVRPEGQLQTLGKYGAGFLAQREWKGLEQNLGQNEPQLATKGRKGLAQSYENELH